MARIEGSVEIKHPLEKVFAYTTEAKSWPKWQAIIMEAEQTSQESMCVGATFKGIARMMGLSMKWTAEANKHELNKNWAKNISCGGMSIAEHVTYDPVEGGIKFSIAYDVKVGGFLKLFSPLVVSTMRKKTEKSLSNLKNILEEQT